jgi:hypothetical protein
LKRLLQCQTSEKERTKNRTNGRIEGIITALGVGTNIYRKVDKIGEEFEDTVVQYIVQKGEMTIGTENRTNGTKMGEQWTRKINYDRID